MLLHSCIVHDTFVTWVSAYYASTPLFSTVPYLWISIVLCPSHSLLSVYVGKYLYVVYLNNMIYINNYIKEITSNQLCSLVYLRVPSGQDFYYVLIREIKYYKI